MIRRVTVTLLKWPCSSLDSSHFKFFVLYHLGPNSNPPFLEHFFPPFSMQQCHRPRSTRRRPARSGYMKSPLNPRAHHHQALWKKFSGPKCTRSRNLSSKYEERTNDNAQGNADNERWKWPLTSCTKPISFPSSFICRLGFLPFSLFFFFWFLFICSAFVSC